MSKLDKVLKSLGDDTVKEMEAMDEASLKKTIVDAEQAMKHAQDELDANPKYEELKENLKAISAGKKEVNKRQKAKIAYSLHLLSDKA